MKKKLLKDILDAYKRATDKFQQPDNSKICALRKIYQNACRTSAEDFSAEELGKLREIVNTDLSQLDTATKDACQTLRSGIKEEVENDLNSSFDFNQLMEIKPDTLSPDDCQNQIKLLTLNQHQDSPKNLFNQFLKILSKSKGENRYPILVDQATKDYFKNWFLPPAIVRYDLENKFNFFVNILKLLQGNKKLGEGRRQNQFFLHFAYELHALMMDFLGFKMSKKNKLNQFNTVKLIFGYANAATKKSFFDQYLDFYLPQVHPEHNELLTQIKTLVPLQIQSPLQPEVPASFLSPSSLFLPKSDSDPLPRATIAESKFPGCVLEEKTLRLLYMQINALREYGKELKKDPVYLAAGNIAVNLAMVLKEQLDNNKIENEQQLIEFKKTFKTVLHSRDKEMNQQLTTWKYIIGNIAIALTGLGLIVLAVRLGHAKLTTGRWSFFFDEQFKRHQQSVDKINQHVDLLSIVNVNPSGNG